VLRDRLLALVVPPCCAVCRAPGLRAGEVLCAACRRALPWLAGPLCPRCALPLPCAVGGRRCPASRAAFGAAWAPVAYAGVARDAVRALKFAGARPLAGAMGAQIAATAPPRMLRGVVVPVPAAPARRRARGFDPAELLARSVARRAGLPLRRALARDGPAARQLGAPRAVRLQAGRIAVRARGPAPARVLLVDDVHTTGATLDACARALMASGAREVRAVTYARTLT
jgi:predicted amidophosphoribosyltransferase